MTINFSNKLCLVIDDFKDFREAIKSMLENCGVQKVDLAANCKDAYELVKKRKYDIILCDLHLQTGKNGHQFLEQVKHENLLKRSGAFILVTSENNPEVVLGIIEHKPDDYIIKPLNAAILRKRIEKALAIKEKLFPIYEAMDNKEYDKALMYCKKAIEASKKYTIICRRLMADIYLEQEDYTSARDLFADVINQRSLPWAEMGLGKSLYALEEYLAAVDVFEKLIDANKVQMEAYDWLAHSKVALGDVQAAINILKRAVDLSPNMITRQTELGKLALETNDNALAEKCFRDAVQLGRNSVYKSANNYIQFAKAVLKNFDVTTPDMNQRKGTEAINALKEVRKDYKSDEDVNVESLLVESKTQKGLGNVMEAKSSLEQATAYFERNYNAINPDIQKELLATCKAANNTACTEIVAKLLAKLNPDDEAMQMQLGDLIETSKYNSDGMRLYERGKYKEAIPIFAKAANEFPTSVSISLNAAQAIIKYIDSSRDLDKLLLATCAEYLQRAEHLEQNDKRQKRYNALRNQYQALKEQAK